MSIPSVIKITAITGALWLSGKMAAQAFVTVPALLQSASQDGLPSRTILQIWRRVYAAGHAHSPQIAALTSTSFVYLSWNASGQGVPTRVPMLLYAGAASLVVGIIPYSVTFMHQTNSRLLAEDAPGGSDSDGQSSKGVSDDTSILELVKTWGSLAAIRSLMPLTGGIMGLFAAVHLESR
ncbi:hypothetical protein FE257_006959 [Aspergillus nanangensis]|uniref:Uncharacterized protein n=1 Tax=Aspergillus nanangensis TaxID=2582783 RepID=A0AAD4CNN7_ASPNN|nr:hypothetical protein FE257_006959 [Aspergillus nanangensis]